MGVAVTENTTLTLPQVAALYRVSTRQVSRWMDDPENWDRLGGYRFKQRGHFRFSAVRIRDLLEGKGLDDG